MSRIRLKSPSIALATLSATLLIAGTAHAQPHRSGNDLPAATAALRVSDSDLPAHVGPKSGFRHNPGFAEAWEHSDDHSARHRHDDDNDSPGS